MTRLTIQIPTPCMADWNTMHPTKQGKHCSLCNKDIVDFTTMTDDEIRIYFTNLSCNQKVCGRFLRSQIQAEEHYLLKLQKEVSTNRILPFRYAALILIGFAIFVTGCNNDKTATGEAIIENTEPKKEEMFLGAPIVTDSTFSSDTMQNQR